MTSATCYECGKPATSHHHVVPESLGGTRTLPLCRGCHTLVVHSPGQALALGNLNHIGRKLKRLQWRCAICSAFIPDGTGYLTCHLSEVRDYLDWHHKKAKGHSWVTYSLGELCDSPPTVRWQFLHSSCDPEPDTNDDYRIDVGRIRTLEEVLDWTVHLSEKNWFHATNWNDLIRDITGDHA